MKQHLEFPNLITDAGLDLIGTGTALDALYTTLAVGTDGSTPNVSDAALGAEVASSTDDGGNDDLDSTESSPLEYAFRRRTRIFSEASANEPLRELGWKVGGVLANRALFKDLNGNPTKVEKTTNDLLRVVYEYRVFAPLYDVTGSIVIGPPACGSIEYFIRPQNVNQNNGWPNLLDNMGSYYLPEARAHQSAVIGSRTGNNDPAPDESETTSSFATYVTGTFFRDMSYRWSFPDANFTGGVNLITWHPWNTSSDLMIWQMFLTQSIDKTINVRLDLTFRQRWDRV